MIFSVIVPFLNEEKLIERCIKALLDQDFPSGEFELIFIDNGSHDLSPDIARRYPVRLLQESQKDPYIARNRGIEAAQGEFIAFTDADCLVDRNWLSGLYRSFQENHADIVIGRLLYPTPTPLSLECHEQYYHVKLDDICRHKRKAYYYGHAGNMAMRTKAFNEIGLFTGMPIVGDTEIIHRLIKHQPDANIVYEPDITAIHAEVTSFWHYLYKQYECGQYSETYRNASSYRPLRLSDNIRLTKLCFNRYQYGPWKTIVFGNTLFSGFLFYMAGRLLRRFHKPDLPQNGKLPNPMKAFEKLLTGTTYLSRSIQSVRLRYTVNGGILGFASALTLLAISAAPVVFSSALAFSRYFGQRWGILMCGALLGTAAGAVWGIRQDGTRYLFGSLRRIYRDQQWRFSYNRRTTPVVRDILASHTIPEPTKTIILIYNSMFGMSLELESLKLPPGCAVTTNRRYLKDAAAVVFHVPTLRKLPEYQRPARQKWVAWFMESGVQYPLLHDPSLMKQFDLMMSYRRRGDIWTPYYFPDFQQLVQTNLAPKREENCIAMFFSFLGELSGRNTYVEELVKHMDVHSYGRFLRNRPLPRDAGRDTKLQVISKYKFNLAYENSIEIDYVTEKFFDPLEVGCVPVYMGAPNVEEFAPGDNCYINAAEFGGPKALAEFLLELNEDDEAYNAYHAWRKQPVRPQYQRLFEEQRIHPLLRLCQVLQERRLDAE